MRKPPRLKVVAGTIRPPEILLSHGTLVSFEVTVNGAKKCELRAWDPATDKTLDIDSLNIVRSVERQAFVAKLPKKYRKEAAGHLLALAEQVIEYHQTPKNSAGNHPEKSADLQTGG